MKGVVNEACASEGHCPFYFGRDKEGGCRYFMAIRIMEGEIDNTDVAGINIVYCGQIKYSKYEDLLNNGEELAIYVSDSATPDQRDVLEPLVRTGMDIISVEKVFGIKYIGMDIHEEGDCIHFKMPFGEMKQCLTKGPDGTPVRIENQVVPSIFNVKVCNSPFWWFKDYGFDFEYQNYCSTRADFMISG
jgi:hypothetical protein